MIFKSTDLFNNKAVNMDRSRFSKFKSWLDRPLTIEPKRYKLGTVGKAVASAPEDPSSNPAISNFYIEA